MSFLVFLLVGFLAGLIARALMPGDQPMSMLATLLLGIVGSFLGGLISAAFTGGPIFALHRSGIFMSIIGAFVVLFIWTTIQRKRHIHA